MTTREALQKAAKFCAYQERSQAEVRRKLLSWGMERETAESIIAELTSQGFLSEQRYANAFVSGKYHLKSWGREKIIRTLQVQGISERCIREALQSVDFSDYESCIRKVAEKWERSHAQLPENERRWKLRAYLFSRGFEPDEIQKVVEEM